MQKKIPIHRNFRSCILQDEIALIARQQTFWCERKVHWLPTPKNLTNPYSTPSIYTETQTIWSLISNLYLQGRKFFFHRFCRFLWSGVRVPLLALHWWMFFQFPFRDKRLCFFPEIFPVTLLGKGELWFPPRHFYLSVGFLFRFRRLRNCRRCPRFSWSPISFNKKHIESRLWQSTLNLVRRSAVRVLQVQQKISLPGHQFIDFSFPNKNIYVFCWLEDRDKILSSRVACWWKLLR